jgi:quinol-cytochrome oxidoreductase complex cytochrome b subunit
MGQFPDSTKSVTEGIGVNEVQLNEALWQKWIDKGKAQDIARRKRFFLALWFFLPALVLLGIWALVLRP